jgi:hypothetical protein
MKEFGARDRLVMAGLVILGLLTVIAGVVSGRSTINYVLSRDAREAALSWAAQLDQGLKQLQPNASELLGRPLQVLRETALATEASTPAVLPGNSSLKGEFNLSETLDSLTTGWLLGHGSDGQTKFASELSGYAVLAGDRAPLAVGGSLTPAALDSVLTQPDVKTAIANAIARTK